MVKWVNLTVVHLLHFTQSLEVLCEGEKNSPVKLAPLPSSICPFFTWPQSSPLAVCLLSPHPHRLHPHQLMPVTCERRMLMDALNTYSSGYIDRGDICFGDSWNLLETIAPQDKFRPFPLCPLSLAEPDACSNLFILQTPTLVKQRQVTHFILSVWVLLCLCVSVCLSVCVSPGECNCQKYTVDCICFW